MTVNDLILKLNTFPVNARIFVQGYEDGYDSIKSVKKITLTKNPKAADYNGEYEEADKKDTTSMSAVVILGNRR